MQRVEKGNQESEKGNQESEKGNQESEGIITHLTLTINDEQGGV